MMIDNFGGQIEEITVFESKGTYTDDGKPEYNKSVVLGIWIDSDKIIQTGLSTSVQAKSKLILPIEIKAESLVERGDILTPTTSSNKIISKKVCRDMQGNFEGVVVYL